MLDDVNRTIEALLKAELLVARGLAPAPSGERRDRDATQAVGRT